MPPSTCLQKRATMACRSGISDGPWGSRRARSTSTIRAKKRYSNRFLPTLKAEYPKAPEGSIDALVDSCSFRESTPARPASMAGPTCQDHADHADPRCTTTRKSDATNRSELIDRPVDETEVLFQEAHGEGEESAPAYPRGLSILFISYLVSWYLRPSSSPTVRRTSKTSEKQRRLRLSCLRTCLSRRAGIMSEVEEYHISPGAGIRCTSRKSCKNGYRGPNSYRWSAS